MKYASIFFTIVIVWIAAIIIAAIVSTTDERIRLFILTIVFTLALFLIGFRKNA